MTTEAIAEPDFSLFLSAADPHVGTVSGDVLDAVEVSVRKSLDTVARIEAVLAGNEGFDLGGTCSASDMRSVIWRAACDRVIAEYIRPLRVDVGDVPAHIEKALLGCVMRKRDEAGALRAWNASRLRQYFVNLIGDPRERRITELRTYALRSLRHDRPEKRWTWYSGEHHTASLRTGLMLRLTYGSENEIRDVFRYIAHLATGEDPLTLTLPPIFGFSDGKEEWPRDEIYKRQKKPFPGVEWIRFTAGCRIEMCVCDDVLPRLQAQWDAAGFTPVQR